jgi:hypothetical protein
MTSSVLSGNKTVHLLTISLQVSDVFLKGHSNGLIRIVGMEGNILEQMDDR